jgi:hypothetical protein
LKSGLQALKGESLKVRSISRAKPETLFTIVIGTTEQVAEKSLKSAEKRKNIPQELSSTSFLEHVRTGR